MPQKGVNYELGNVIADKTPLNDTETLRQKQQQAKHAADFRLVSRDNISQDAASSFTSF